jgi:hypothetical protein
MKTECLQQNETQHYFGGKGKNIVALIKSLIYERLEEALEERNIKYP